MAPYPGAPLPPLAKTDLSAGANERQGRCYFEL